MVFDAFSREKQQSNRKAQFYDRQMSDRCDDDVRGLIDVM